jgi:hypothetical protein
LAPRKRKRPDFAAIRGRIAGRAASAVCVMVVTRIPL